ncbi:hypothetical protein GCM10023321_85520 [Pseudonocardia eucalypti]|uniref:Uncharacterized protein n=1 Tax=Pseudonocardia eucalypti TaxID=648755 RepID=A0ABP9RF86_9PSEU|nr:hypothetical protein [Pseudonocardia eucalypti]MBB6380758.1 hypothetical protein [Pseudonocardia eucalypti]
MKPQEQAHPADRPKCECSDPARSNGHEAYCLFGPLRSLPAVRLKGRRWQPEGTRFVAVWVKLGRREYKKYRVIQ